MRPIARAAATFVLAVSSGAANAASIAGVSPQGEVATVRQVVVRFDAAVVAAGDPRLPAPAAIACSGGTPEGEGRWTTERQWVYDFREPLPPGLRCTLRVRPEWRPIAGGTLSGATEFAFATGGPAIAASQPWDGATIAEDQHFLVRPSGPVVPASVEKNVRCEVDNLAEALPVRIVGGAERDAVLRARRLAKQADRWLLLACARPLPAATKMRLVWGRGVASARDPAVVTRADQRLNFEVRPAFAAEFTCERERADAACLPIRPLVLRFSTPVPRATAEAVRLVPEAAGGKPIAPRFDRDDREAEASEVRFAAPLPANARFRIELPENVRDAAGRALANAASFPLAVATGDAPPIAKFAAAPFGIVEWSAAEGAALPVTLRHVQGDLRAQSPTGTVRLRTIEGDAAMQATLRTLRRWHEATLPAKELGLPKSEWTVVEEDVDDRGRKVQRRVDKLVATREVSLLDLQSAAAPTQRLDLPALQGGDPRPFEVVGIPLAKPGFHVVEIASRRLGEALLDKPSAPMFVRTGVLVTNLGVHFKRGRENALVWVTTLDRAKPVDAADVSIVDCAGKQRWAGRTGADGIARVPVALEEPPADCEEGWFVVARKAGAGGVVDTSFVAGAWQRGIEPWRFAHPIARGARPEAVAHTAFDRTLLRAGETVSMKHFIRVETGAGLALRRERLPTTLKIVHDGSNQEVTQPLTWDAARGSAANTWAIPPASRLGRWRVVLVDERARDDEPREWESGAFRVEAFRVPLVDAQLAPPRGAAIAPNEIALGVQLGFMAGGPMSGAPLRATAVLREREPSFAAPFAEFSFAAPRDPASLARRGDDEDDEAPPGNGKVIADKVALTTDRAGAATWTLRNLSSASTARRAGRIDAEVSYTDPNGEVQTVSTSIDTWPAAVLPGIRTGAWASERGKIKFTVAAVDVQGKAVAEQPLDVRARLVRVLSSRKRLVGGFYAYDTRTEVKDIGNLCSGRSDTRGLLLCEAELAESGQVELIATTKDAAGRSAESAATIWIARGDDLWFEPDDDDRIDIVADKPAYAPGETARLQVRMPFREATALVTVEREGVVSTEVLTLRGRDPAVEVKLAAGHAPNVYASVLVLRGRVRDVPWTSFFRWGWRHPIEWARAWWFEGREHKPPTAFVDLAKPTYRLGVAALRVGTAAQRLDVQVSTDRTTYPVRGKAVATVRVTHGGKPLPAGETVDLAFAAVDEGLLALAPNRSWELLGALWRARGWGVETSSAQGEIVGRRHYGRKAVAAGGGGGRGATRELFDTLLLWRASVPVAADGTARIEVPLNDSLTAFRLVALAAAGADKFGDGGTTIRVSQDLQILAGLPPLVRDGDRYTPTLTLRNATARDLTVKAALAGTATVGAAQVPLALAPQELKLAAGTAAELSWPGIDVPLEATSIRWEASADAGGGTSDRLAVTQAVAAAVPLRVWQASLVQVDAGGVTLPVAPPAGARSAGGKLRGGIVVAAQPRLAGTLPGVRRYFEAYPYACLEQQAAKAIGLGDAALWQKVADSLAAHLDADGLAGWFPPRAGEAARGSDRLTAHLLAAAHEAGLALPAAAREAMLGGLQAFVEGRIERRFWSPRPDAELRRIAAIEALARHGRAEARMLGTVEIAPNRWPTGTLIEWRSILKRVRGVPDAPRRLAEADAILRSRIAYSGTALRFADEAGDFAWWLMDSADANAAKLILAVLDDPAWRDELGKLVAGAIARQKNGAWLTTTANTWGTLAAAKFGARFESRAPDGWLVATLGGSAPLPVVEWAASPAGARLELSWPVAGGAPLAIAQQGAGAPWATVQALAAVALDKPLAAGYAIARSVSAVERRNPERWSRGDVVRVRLEIDAATDMTWVVVADPIPAGATILGSGLARDSALATASERSGGAGPAYDERAFDSMRRTFEFLPRGQHVVEYTLRLNASGRFGLPPTRVEAMYAPETFGEAPNAAWEVAP